MQGMKGLADDSRPGTPRRITDAQVEAAVTQTSWRAMPTAATHWSTRSLAQKVGLESERRGPHLAQLWFATASASETFKLSTDPWLVEKVRDIVGLYLNPARTCHRAVAWMKNRRYRRWIRTQPDSCRCGLVCRNNEPAITSGMSATTSLFAALDIATGER